MHPSPEDSQPYLLAHSLSTRAFHSVVMQEATSWGQSGLSGTSKDWDALTRDIRLRTRGGRVSMVRQ